ncbi:MAG: glycosyltransferase family 39 protein [Bacteroidales bacterium]|nr:glycosyltransferase family 39 protein [Bacteroidales bacterium]MBN2748266.1 glycosyltransferase family 39 protein [Bacteroidales bacterium]
MKLQLHHYFFISVGFLFLGITSVNLFSEGMFLDGMLYADISRNMARGLGSFWQPHLTNTLFNEFYEHPPLALGLQSSWFLVFGESIMVERFYSLFTFIVVGYLIFLIWGQITTDKKSAWLPLLFWIIIPDVAWAAANNMLENTMSVFVYLSVFFYMVSLKHYRFLWIFLAGLSLSLGLLTKGFVCLYIWTLPLFIWIFTRKGSFIKIITDTVVLIIATGLPLVIVYYAIPAAQHNFQMYFTKQVLGSIESAQTVETRFAILGAFFKNAIIPIVLGAIAIAVAIRKGFQRRLLNQNRNYALALLLVVLSGVFPIMISMKQRNFYILTVYPLFAIALSYYLYPLFGFIRTNINFTNKSIRSFKIATVTLVVISILLAVLNTSRVGRDKVMINDCKAIIGVTGEDTTIGICPDMYGIWSLHGYFSRYGNVSLDYGEDGNHQYFISLNGCGDEFIKKNYSLVELDTKEYKLYKRVVNN